jgi:hypothetical protein
MILDQIRSRPIVWRKSSYCAAGECIEIAQKNDVILMRSTLAPRAVVRFTAAEWRAFSQGLQAGEFRDLG